MTKVRKHHEINAAAKLIADWRSMMIVHVIYENGPIRYSDIADLLELSPTILSGKLARLAEVGIVTRKQEKGAKEVIYETKPCAKNMVEAYHLLEEINYCLPQKRNRNT